MVSFRFLSMAMACMLSFVATEAQTVADYGTEQDAGAVSADADSCDSCVSSAPYIHRLEVEMIEGGIFHTNEFLIGENEEQRTMNHSATLKLKYAFLSPEGSRDYAIYRDAYQGVGLSFHNFNPLLGRPVSAFIFQGARLLSLSRRVSLDYEWNLGLTFGWHPYDAETNPDNRVIGSRVTACIDADFYINWMLSRHADLNIGFSLAHYSNGNTKYPNKGLNTLGAKIGLAYYINRSESYRTAAVTVSPFDPHFSCDVVLFGSWRSGMLISDENTVYATQGKYAVCGLNVNPMYNVNHWFNAGLSLDGVYDSSANLYFDNGYVSSDAVRRPAASRQMTLGFSARAEFVMPWFTINMGFGKNVINARGNFAHPYQMLALKINLVRNMFAHIGYCLDDFKYPNYLMLGVGYRIK